MKKNPAEQIGFSLPEILITVAIVGILAAFAVPGYQQYLIGSRHVDAQQLLSGNAKRLERCFTLTGVYNGTCTLKTSSESGYYTATAARTATTYTLTATPTDKGGQSSDTRCTQFTLNELRVTGASGTDATRCW